MAQNALSRVQESLRANLVGYLVLQDPFAKFVKLGDLIHVARLGGLKVDDLSEEYAELLKKYSLTRFRLRGAPMWTAQAVVDAWKLAGRLLSRIPADILIKASEDLRDHSVNVGETGSEALGGRGKSES